MDAIEAGTATAMGTNGADYHLAHTGKLPDYYVAPGEDMSPGQMIGGNVYNNSDERLPDEPGRIWYEADINYIGGPRGKERIIYSNDGLIFVTYDDYHTFVEVKTAGKQENDENNKWLNPDGSTKWPPNNGFEGTPKTETLQPGTIVDRYGGETGKFVSPEGTPYSSRSLPPGSDTRPYNVYEVLKPIDVQSGEIAPWFDQSGGGIQYQFTQTIEELIQLGYLGRLP